MLVGSSRTEDLVGPSGGLVGPSDYLVSKTIAVTGTWAASFSGSKALGKGWSLTKSKAFVFNKASTKIKSFSRVGTWTSVFKGGKLFIVSFTLSKTITFAFDRTKIFGRFFSISKPNTYLIKGTRGIGRVLNFIRVSYSNVTNKLGVLFRPTRD